MTPHDDEEVSALQAADVIAWAARKRQVEGPLKGEFSPLENLFKETAEHQPVWQGWHSHLDMPLESIKMFATPLYNWLHVNGRMPELGEMLR